MSDTYGHRVDVRPVGVRGWQPVCKTCGWTGDVYKNTNPVPKQITAGGSAWRKALHAADNHAIATWAEGDPCA